MKITRNLFIKHYQRKQNEVIVKSCILTLIIYVLFNWDPFVQLLHANKVGIEELGNYFFSVVLGFSLITHPIIAIMNSYSESKKGSSINGGQ